MTPKKTRIAGKYLVSWIIMCGIWYVAADPLLHILRPGGYQPGHRATALAIGFTVNTLLVTWLLVNALKRLPGKPE